MIKEGDKIRFFEDTNVGSYVRFIESKGFNCYIKGFYIFVGERKTYDTKSIGSRIKRMRELIYFGRGEMAKELGISQAKYDSWEAGKEVPEGKELKAFCELTNSTKDYVLYGRGKWNSDADSLLEASWIKNP